MSKQIRVLLIVSSCFFINMVVSAQTLDTLVMGSSASEEAHDLRATFPPVIATDRRTSLPPSDPSEGPSSDVIKGGKGEPTRRLLPRTPMGDMYGGQLTFKMKVDPTNQNYFTVKFWGSDSSPDGALILYCDGFEIGKRHGPSAADMFANAGGAWFPGRFWYRTATLPLKLTKGKQSVTLTLRSAGKINDYSNNRRESYIPSYQHLMHEPSWEIYRAYTHVGGCVDTVSEVQGDPFVAPVRNSPSATEAVDTWKQIVIEKVANLLKGRTPSQKDALYLAQCYELPWTQAYHNPEVIKRVIDACDNVAKAYAANNKDPGIHGNDSWGGSYDPMGEAIWLLYPQMKDRMTEVVGFGGTLGRTTRKEGWSKALRASVDYGRRHSRGISNQAVIWAASIYSANKGLQLVDASNALTEAQALVYPYEAAGLSPWHGDDPLGEPVLRTNTPNGPKWFMVTTKGTTKEPSFVGADYGEMGAPIYRIGRMANDRKLMDQGLMMLRARAYFHVPGVDHDGFRCITSMDAIGIRNNNMPGHEVYITRDVSTTGASIVAYENAPDLVGWFQEEVADDQIPSLLELFPKTARNRPGKAGLPDAPYFPDDYAAAMAKPTSEVRLPQAAGSPDFAWGDEENMVVSAKHGEERFFANMVWRGNLSINGTAMVFLTTPLTAMRAEVRLDDIRYVPTGKYETMDGSVDVFRDSEPPDNKLYPNAEIGNRYPIAVRPDLVGHVPENNLDGGRGTGYTLCYGHWLVGMNGNYTTGDYTMKLPPGFKGGRDLVSGKEIKAPVIIPKGTTVVFYLQKPASIPTTPWTTTDSAAKQAADSN